MNMEDKTALVLGAVRGIGRGIALALLEEGVRVAAGYFDWEDHLPEMKVAFARTGKDHLIARADLREQDQAAGLVQQVIDRFGRLDILINNIERGGWPVVHGAYTPAQWNLEMETTLRAKHWVWEAAMPHLKSSGNGCVINLSSVAAQVGRSGPAAVVFNDGYAAASRGMSVLTETWARAGAPEVRANEIMLGFVETRHAEATRGWGMLAPDQRQAILDHTLMGRTGKIDDVVRLVLFLIKDAPFMTGSVIRLDGGYVLGGDRTGPLPAGVEKIY